jgi:MtN3 and saliva related transmembrane protein
MDQLIIKEIFGWIAVVLTATQLIPQTIKSFKTRSTRDLSWLTFLQTVVISVLWVFYGIWHGSFEIIFANIMVNISCLVIVMLKYSVEKPKINGSLIAAFVSALIISIVVAGFVPFLRVILGWVVVVLNVTQLIPQAIKSFRTKSTKDLSWWTFGQIFVITVLWTTYGIWNGLAEVIVTNAVVGVVCGAILIRKSPDKLFKFAKE